MRLKISDIANRTLFCTFDGSVEYESFNKQSFTSKRTLGGKKKQKWTRATFRIYSVLIERIEERHKKSLENMFLLSPILEFEAEFGDKTQVVFEQQALVLNEFKDLDGNVYYKGQLTLETV